MTNVRLATTAEDPALLVRFPPNIHQLIKEAAATSGRSQSRECLYRIAQTFEKELAEEEVAA